LYRYRISGAGKVLAMNTKKHSLSYILSVVAQRDSAQVFAVLDTMPNPTALPFVCDVNRAGHDGHRWAWDQLEEWQTQD
tara:strand:+ start:217 stop:453 length:237 start_codon:yes stop_codon:yes gene_type:complete